MRDKISFVYRHFTYQEYGVLASRISLLACESKTTKICEFAINYHLMNDKINIKTMYT